MTKLLMAVLFGAVGIFAFASDGRVPLGQAATISAPGSYYVTADISVPVGGAIFNITSDDVTIDLNGHVLSAAGNTVIFSSGHKNLRVTNGRIDGCAFGVYFLNGTGFYQVDNLSITNVTIVGIYFAGSSGNTFTCIVQDNNISLGASASQGLWVYYATHALIARNSFLLNSTNGANANGIYFWNSTGGVIRDNVITGSPGHGLSLSTSANNTITHNAVYGVTGSSAAGIYLANTSTGNTIEWNTTSGNAWQGIQITSGCNNCSLDWNSSFQNGAWGIVISATNCVYSYNRTRGNTAGGISFAAGNTDGGGNY